MKSSFWQKLKKKKGKKPILSLAPMADVTDAAFRTIIAKYGKPDVLWTEFVSADGLCSSGQKALLHLLKFSPKERPIVAQIFGSQPENMKKAGALIQKMGFDGVDINMGCPDRQVERQGSGSAHMKDPVLAREIIRAVKAGAPKLPVSVKTRVGYNKDELDAWLPQILAEDPDAVTIHARTRKELSEVPANWEYVKRAVEIRNKLKSKALIFGNGDISGVSDALEKAKYSGADGVMIGRAIFGNPELFAGVDLKQPLDIKNKKDKAVISKRLKMLLEHTKTFEKKLGKEKNFAVMKKHFKAYVSNWTDAKELRIALMGTDSVKEVEKVISEYQKCLKA